jgi:hypothetical protein
LVRVRPTLASHFLPPHSLPSQPPAPPTPPPSHTHTHTNPGWRPGRLHLPLFLQRAGALPHGRRPGGPDGVGQRDAGPGGVAAVRGGQSGGGGGGVERTRHEKKTKKQRFVHQYTFLLSTRCVQLPRKKMDRTLPTSNSLSLVCSSKKKERRSTHTCRRGGMVGEGGRHGSLSLFENFRDACSLINGRQGLSPGPA